MVDAQSCIKEMRNGDNIKIIIGSDTTLQKISIEKEVAQDFKENILCDIKVGIEGVKYIETELYFSFRIRKI